MEPHWLTIVSWIALALGFASALVIAVDELLLGWRQQMWVMNLVHPITALYLGPVWLWAYFARGRRSAGRRLRIDAERLAAEDVDVERLREDASSIDGRHLEPWHVANAASHCGAGCTLGDIAGEWIVFALGPWTIAASTLWPEYVLDLPLAWTLGIAFQYFTIAPMRDGGMLESLRQAVKADTLSILGFEVGLFGWMALSHSVLWRPPLAIDTNGHWFMMQVGMICGFATAWPVNRWLVEHGFKEKMDSERISPGWSSACGMRGEARRAFERGRPSRGGEHDEGRSRSDVRLGTSERGGRFEAE